MSFDIVPDDPYAEYNFEIRRLETENNALLAELLVAREVMDLLKSLLSEDGVKEIFTSYNTGSQLMGILEESV